VLRNVDKMLGLVSQTVKHRNISIMVCIYYSLVRPQYSTSVWNPHYQKDKLLLEKVQRQFTQLFDDLEYKDRLEVWTWTVVLGGKTSPIRFNWTLQNGSRAICHTADRPIQVVY